MKRPLVLVGIILLVGGVLFEEKHRAETFKHHIVAPELSYPELEAQCLATNGSFSGRVNLWDNALVKSEDAHLNHASLAVQGNLNPAGFETLQPNPGNQSEPAITVLDREVTYALFASRDFTLTLNLKPEYSNPDALMPSHIDPGIRGSISF